MSGGSIQEDPRLRLALTKAPVHFLNASSDFQPWHAALRHLVTTVNMQDGLLYSLPYDEVVEHKRAELGANPRVARTNPETPAPNKKDKDPKNKSKSDEKKDGTAGATLGATLDVTPFVAPEDSLPFLGGPNESPKSPVSRRLAPSALMASMKVSALEDSFFASANTFYNCRMERKESPEEIFYRHVIWHWLEQSVAKGVFKWITGLVKPIFDIKRFYKKIIENANKATQISHSLEMEKLYKMQPGPDLLQFHADVVKQLPVIEAQEAELTRELGCDFSLPDYGASILLRAVYHHPKFETIAIDFSKRKRRCKIEEIVVAIQEQQLLLDHLKKDPERQRHTDPEVKVKAAKMQQKICFAFQKGGCTRAECPFLHEKEQKPKQSQKSPDKGSKTGPCDKCGGNHPRTECKFSGDCGFCHAKGHKEAVCRKKAAGKVKAQVATGQDACVSIRCSIAEDGNTLEDGIEGGTEGGTDDGTSTYHDGGGRFVHLCSHTQASVLTEGEVRAAPAICERDGTSFTRWCVDSGANRDICSEYDLYGSEPTPKIIRIGEAGKGHAFMSKAEGAIMLTVKGKELPLFNRVIYADQVSENIMSVAEAVDRGYSVVFTTKGVQICHADDVKVAGSILNGNRDKDTRLFYLVLPKRKIQKSGATLMQVVQGGKHPMAMKENTKSEALRRQREVPVPKVNLGTAGGC